MPQNDTASRREKGPVRGRGPHWPRCRGNRLPEPDAPCGRWPRFRRLRRRGIRPGRCGCWQAWMKVWSLLAAACRAISAAALTSGSMVLNSPVAVTRSSETAWFRPVFAGAPPTPCSCRTGSPRRRPGARTSRRRRPGARIAIIAGASDNVIVDNTITTNQGEGVFVQNSVNNRLEGNQITGSGDTGLVLEGSSGNTLLTNTLGDSSDGAIVLQLGSNDNLVQSNSFAQNADAGLTVSDSTGNRILSNALQGSGDSGIVLQSSHGTTVTGNDVSGNTGGIELSYSDNNLIRSNIANDTTGDGISLSHSLNNHLELNQANGNSSRGIYVDGEAASGAGNQLIGNTTNANRGDGIDVSKATHTIRGNTARDNDSWGIFADPGNIDGGSNLAGGNAESAQCTGVVCTP
ncbi:nitrous oxide reductase family maturation protein NosD [Streptomyces sp. NPDC059863]|uniref:right-handed parallel beta-helix repeat-containing protein n=2 Tax=unclassified Streptomyces TaxID=2593676 RepID=UPI00365DA315